MRCVKVEEVSSNPAENNRFGPFLVGAHRKESPRVRVQQLRAVAVVHLSIYTDRWIPYLLIILSIAGVRRLRTMVDTEISEVPR